MVVDYQAAIVVTLHSGSE